jgi:hypothetical protein
VQTAGCPAHVNIPMSYNQVVKQSTYYTTATQLAVGCWVATLWAGGAVPQFDGSTPEHECRAACMYHNIFCSVMSLILDRP